MELPILTDEEIQAEIGHLSQPHGHPTVLRRVAKVQAEATLKAVKDKLGVMAFLLDAEIIIGGSAKQDEDKGIADKMRSYWAELENSSADWRG